MKHGIIFFIEMLVCLCLMAQTDNAYNLMPVPSSVEITSERFRIDGNFRMSVTGSYDTRILAESSRFIRRLGERTGIFLDKLGFVTEKDNDISAPLTLKIKRPGKLTMGENESYTIECGLKQTIVNAETDLGAIHALESLLQLVSVDTGFGLTIKDEPRFVWRGLLLDVALHFMPVNVVKRNLDGMAAVKMNVLHLHLSNDQGFRVESKVFPQLQKYSSEGQYYTQADIKEIIRYAGQRGIRIVPEFVSPAHTTAILVAFPELASVKKKYTLERYFGVFDPVMDPTNPQVYTFLDKLYTEMAGLFPDTYFHIGGDENTGKDWENTPHIKNYMKSKGMKNYMDLQTEFNKKILPIITRNGKKMMGWDEILQPGVPKDIIIQSWRGKEAFFESVKKGYQAILSHGYYIDLVQDAATHYLNDPVPDSVQLTKEQIKLILGGEATMWSELISTETVDSRIWPRLAPIAERLWSSRDIRDVENMYKRMNMTSLRLEELGLRHLSFKPAYLRRLANGTDTKALEILVNVVEPLKIYERNSGDTMYTVFSPLTKLADVATPDQELPRLFRSLVREFLDKRTPALERQITDQLMIWKDNDSAFRKTLRNSPVLEEAAGLSENLSKIATVGLEALQFIRGGSSPGKSWTADQIIILQSARQSGGRCELQVVDPIEKLVEAAGDNGVRIMNSFGNTCMVIPSYH
ncbi:MAG: family 20 glycosylhydrolase [Flavitalea sp.]